VAIATMPHTTNRKAFGRRDERDGRDGDEPLLRLYTLLVALELTLKDRAGSYPLSHDIDALVQPLITPEAANLQATLNAFMGSLSALRCTFNGQDAPVHPKKYPGLRYLRFAKDGFAGGSRDAAVMQALRDAEQLVDELKRIGIQI
jgi:hypothetical protein